MRDGVKVGVGMSALDVRPINRSRSSDSVRASGPSKTSQISIASFDVDLEFLPEQVDAGTHSMGHLKSSYGPSGKN